MKELTIEIRPTTIIIGTGDAEEAKKILQAALEALEAEPKSVYRNELVFAKK